MTSCQQLCLSSHMYWSVLLYVTSHVLLTWQEGTVLRGQGNPEATAFFIHSRLHLNRKAPTPTLAVLHTHMPYTTAL